MRQVVVTIETSGEDVREGHRIIEIGCVELINERPTGSHYHTYINPERDIEISAMQKHGVVDEFLKDKPIFSETISSFLDFVGLDEVVTYDANHLLSFIHHEIALTNFIKNTNHEFNNDIVDILAIGMERHPNQSNSLSDLCERYYVTRSKNEYAGALFKAELLAKLLQALINESTKKITSDLSRYEKGDNLVVVETFSEFDSAIDGISKTALCRGVSNHEYPLLPSLFRHADVELADTREHNLMWVFKTHAKPYLDSSPCNEIEWLAIAQHHGLPTRLLDWSLSPLVACFFAVQSLTNTDAAIYVYDVGRFRKEEELDISKLTDIVAFFPSHATKRLTSQSGMFTIHPTSNMKLESPAIKKIVIRAERKKYFLEKLIKYGVHQGTIFPDLDGLSSYLSYLNGYK